MNNNINETIHSFILSSEKDKEKPNILTTIESAYLRLLLFLQTKFTYGHSASDSYHFSNVIKEKVSLFLLIHSSEDKGTLPDCKWKRFAFVAVSFFQMLNIKKSSF